MPYSNDPIRRLVAIDGDPQTLALIQDVLRSDFLEIFTSSDRNEGMALIREKRPHIVLLDKGMPNDVGIGLLEQIMDLDPGIETVVLTVGSGNGQVNRNVTVPPEPARIRVDVQIGQLQAER